MHFVTELAWLAGTLVRVQRRSIGIQKVRIAAAEQSLPQLRSRGVAGSTVQRVAPAFAVQLIEPTVAVQQIVVGTATHEVVAVATSQQIESDAAIDIVRVIATVERIMSRAAEDEVDPGSRIDNIVAVRLALTAKGSVV